MGVEPIVEEKKHPSSKVRAYIMFAPTLGYNLGIILTVPEYRTPRRPGTGQEPEGKPPDYPCTSKGGMAVDSLQHRKITLGGFFRLVIVRNHCRRCRCQINSEKKNVIRGRSD
ncbi:uncharacterized protein BO80DRAFT_129884 [Aspergillus ibericus CBS 121593]|uniref:Uncharacterized protein n=1 Tax=Aspergillus ibericus CBS 121593 TaxID=1448316 RepID=A0A395HCE0_9EURO|nr:hypothetical protein BO80DRAFT_129884 [Aspergillus ibericus CBS 121593]RAL05183.1 hypothetical protein BO80DRAFT_129884 [Aspergillus ibericus CBS 121593]